MSNIHITITGPQGSEPTTTVIARAVLKLLLEADIACAMPEEASNPTDGDSIEALGYLMRKTGPLRVIVQTASRSASSAG